MANSISTFSFNDLSLTAVSIDDEFWFKGVDVAKALGYIRPSDAIAARVHSKDKKDINLKALFEGETNSASYRSPLNLNENNNNRVVTYINEPGLYSLIFGSKLPSAEAFKDWVTHEVLPALRKTGTYTVPKAPTHKCRLETKEAWLMQSLNPEQRKVFSQYAHNARRAQLMAERKTERKPLDKKERVKLIGTLSTVMMTTILTDDEKLRLFSIISEGINE